MSIGTLTQKGMSVRCLQGTRVGPVARGRGPAEALATTERARLLSEVDVQALDKQLTGGHALHDGAPSARESMRARPPGAAAGGLRRWSGPRTGVSGSGIALFRGAPQPGWDRCTTAVPRGCNLQHTTLFTDIATRPRRKQDPV
ncbi:hypothetical protein GCM10007147_07920 [Nocardiopsis kunsanensis]|uniref:Uncharacterized protein n=1 Tax=Nocardiopsis kunsanensis TaxID=141693 RepID=A0A918X8E7_9ACTN|nr:hypothetical protein GCM10007147_07920 [Nocardiopsis kunsanensis]